MTESRLLVKPLSELEYFNRLDYKISKFLFSSEYFPCYQCGAILTPQKEKFSDLGYCTFCRRVRCFHCNFDCFYRKGYNPLIAELKGCGLCAELCFSRKMPVIAKLILSVIGIPLIPIVMVLGPVIFIISNSKEWTHKLFDGKRFSYNTRLLYE